MMNRLIEILRRCARRGTVFATVLLTILASVGCSDIPANDAETNVSTGTDVDTGSIDAQAAEHRDSRPSIGSDQRSAGTTGEHDWDAVSSIGVIRGTRELMNLLRHLDVSYAGEQESVTVTWQPPGDAVDDRGGKVIIVAEEWKGILDAIAERAADSADGIARWRAMPSDMYRDGHGQVTRYNYRVFIETDDRLRFENDGRVD